MFGKKSKHHATIAMWHKMIYEKQFHLLPDEWHDIYHNEEKILFDGAKNG